MPGKNLKVIIKKMSISLWNRLCTEQSNKELMIPNSHDSNPEAHKKKKLLQLVA